MYILAAIQTLTPDNYCLIWYLLITCCACFCIETQKEPICLGMTHLLRPYRAYALPLVQEGVLPKKVIETRQSPHRGLGSSNINSACFVRFGGVTPAAVF